MRFALLIFIFCYLSSSEAAAQLQISAEEFMLAPMQPEKALPFWMYHNRRGRISQKSNFIALLGSDYTYALDPESSLSLGAAVYYDAANSGLKTDELFLNYRNSWLTVTIGRKQREEFYYGLSASNESILWSLNARPLPGIQLSTSRSIMFFPEIGLGFEAALEEYIMEEDRFVSRARLHHKSFHLVYEPTDELQFKVGLQHFVQWAGTSAALGPQPSGFDDYLRILTGQGGGNDASHGDQLNALGNNLGSYEAAISYEAENFEYQLVWNSIFEDGSGRRLGNTPDGRYGLFIARKEQNHWLNGLMYEFYYSKHQSHTTTGAHKFDNFFNNGVYRSGWTYHNKVLGVPFFTVADDGDGVVNNQILVHHLGLGGMTSETTTYKFLISYRKNYGTTKAGYYPETQNILSTYLETQLWNSWIDISTQIAADFSSHHTPNFGLGLKIQVLF